MSRLRPSAAAVYDGRELAEGDVSRDTDRAMRDFLLDVNASAQTYLRTPQSLVAAAVDPLTLGQVRGWWFSAVRRLDRSIERAWRRGYRMHSDGKVLDTSMDAFVTYMQRVHDRLVDGLTPPLPDDAFNTVRLVITQGAAQGWSTAKTSERLAASLSWEKRGPYWRRELTRLNREIDKILDPLGAPGTPAREHARNNDARVRSLQTDRATVVKQLDAEQSHWQTRANRIARTESTGAYNYGAERGLQAEGVLCKEWLATADARTRGDHLAAMGQIVPMGMPFSVGGFSMQRPGDPSAPPEETVNCRCCVVGGESC